MNLEQYDEHLEELYQLWEECFADIDGEIEYDWELASSPEDLDEFFDEDDLEEANVIKVYHQAHELVEENADKALFLTFESTEDEIKYGIKLLKTAEDFDFAKLWIRNHFNLT